MSKNKIIKIIYIVLFMCALIIPGIWTFVDKQEAVGNETQVDFSDVNYMNFASKADKFMSQKFGFRNNLVQMNSALYYNLFNESSNSEVIAGKDGWLFYKQALDDYTGKNELSEDEIAKIVKILQIVEKNVEKEGKKFVFVSAPNKMEIYDEFMSENYLKEQDAGNYEGLFIALKDAGVSSVDLKKLLKAEAEKSDIPIYYRQDSHWNRLGAAYAYEAIMNQAEMEYTKYTDKEFVINKNYQSDLYKMLFPMGKEFDENIEFTEEFEFYYMSRFNSTDDIVIETANDNKDKSVLMYRDSFGAQIYEFIANDFGQAMFRRDTIYDFSDLSDTDLVIIELVERNLDYLLTYLPVINAGEAELSNIKSTDGEAVFVTSSVNGGKLLTATCEEIPSDCTDVYFRIMDTDGEHVYEAYPAAKDGDACMYFDELSSDCKVSLIYEYNGELYETVSKSLE